jgi:putative component of toxin-antitoxin plasmid stabilization module
MPEIRILEYLDIKSRSPFAAWFEGLPAVASAKVAAALYQLAAGNWSNVKGVGAGVLNGRSMPGRAIASILGRTVTGL